MKLFIRFIPLLLVIVGILNYMYLTKELGLTVVLLALGVIIAIYNLMKKQYIFIASLSVVIVIGLVSLFTHLVYSGV